MIQINENISINENEITQLVKVENTYYAILSSGERIRISQEIFEELEGKG